MRRGIGLLSSPPSAGWNLLGERREDGGVGSRISDLSLVLLLKVMRAFIHSDYKCRTDGAGEEARGRKRIKVGCLRVKTALRGELCLSCLG